MKRDFLYGLILIPILIGSSVVLAGPPSDHKGKGAEMKQKHAHKKDSPFGWQRSDEKRSEHAMEHATNTENRSLMGETERMHDDRERHHDMMEHENDEITVGNHKDKHKEKHEKKAKKEKHAHHGMDDDVDINTDVDSEDRDHGHKERTVSNDKRAVKAHDSDHKGDHHR